MPLPFKIFGDVNIDKKNIEKPRMFTIPNLFIIKLVVGISIFLPVTKSLTKPNDFTLQMIIL